MCAFSRTVICLIVGQGSGRLQQQATMAEGDAEMLEILICQLRQDGGRDVVLSERLLIALQPQLPQPSADVHPPLAKQMEPQRERYQSYSSETTIRSQPPPAMSVLGRFC